MVFLAAGFGFKMAIVPFQMWAPDVYQGAPTPVAAFLSVGSKAAAFAVVMRIFFEGFGADTFVSDDWKILFAVLAAVTMTVGNVMALRQTNIRRMLGYSSIAQAGQLPRRPGRDLRDERRRFAARRERRRVLPRDVRLHEPRRVLRHHGDLATASAATRSPTTPAWAAARRSPPLVLAFCLLSLTGLPPTAGFFAKMYIFNAGDPGRPRLAGDHRRAEHASSRRSTTSASSRQMYLTTADGEPADLSADADAGPARRRGRRRRRLRRLPDAPDRRRAARRQRLRVTLRSLRPCAPPCGAGVASAATLRAYSV